MTKKDKQLIFDHFTALEGLYSLMSEECIKDKKFKELALKYSEVYKVFNDYCQEAISNLM